MIQFRNSAACFAFMLTFALACGAAGEEATTQPAESDQSSPESPVVPAFASPLTIEELVAELGFETAYDRRRVRIEPRDGLRLDYRQTNRSVRFEETVGLRGRGALFDERVMTFDLGARWGLSQERYVERRPGRDLTESPHGDLLEYDASVTLLPRGKISADGFASRIRSRVPRMFLPSVDRTLERYGVELRYHDARLPMRLSYEHTWDALSSRTRRLIDDEQRGTDALRYEATWQISEHHSLRLDYEYEDRRERYSGGDATFDTIRNYLTLEHNLRFGRDRRSSWQTIARFQDETGDLARDAAELSTRLRLQHTDSLASHYGFQFLRESFLDLKTRTWRGEAGLTHQLGDALTTTLHVYALRQGANENADFSEWGGLAHAAYRRENALGRFSANFSYNRAATEFSDGGRVGVVLSESVTFRDPLNAYLAHTDVDRASLVVTDLNRARVYLPGQDYVVLRFGPYTALRRVASGRIADRQTVLVSYTYRVSIDRKIQRDRFDVRVQQDFEFGLTPYYAGSFQFEDADRWHRSPYRERDIQRHRIGATFRRPRWSVGAEYEYNDDSTDPYQAGHFNADAVLWHTAQAQLDGRANLSQYRFRGIDVLRPRDALVVDLGASLRYLVTRDLELTGGAFYRYEDDSSFGITRGVDLTAGVEYRIGLFALSFELEYDVLRLPGSRDDGLSFWVKLRRDIPILTRGAP